MGAVGYDLGMRKIFMAIVLTVGACGGSSNPPTCQDSIQSFYAAGCVLTSGSGVAVTETAAFNACTSLVEAAPSECISTVNDLLDCFGSVMGPVTASSQCDCSTEQTAVEECR
jgi:hypothetical protein